MVSVTGIFPTNVRYTFFFFYNNVSECLTLAKYCASILGLFYKSGFLKLWILDLMLYSFSRAAITNYHKLVA